MDTMGARIAAARAKKGLTQQELSNAAETSVGVISALERGASARPGVPLMGKIAEALGVTINDLVGPHGEAAEAAERKGAA